MIRVLMSYFHQLKKLCFRKIFNVFLKREYEYQRFEPNERVIEYSFVFQSLLGTFPTSVLDVGTGKSSLPHLLKICGFTVMAIDNMDDYWSKPIFNRHFYLINDDITKTKIRKKFDFITCISTLEHIKDYNSAVKSMFKLLKPKGHLTLTFPYNEKEYVENVYQLPGAGFGKHVSYICRIYSRKQLNNWLRTNNGKIVKQEYWQCYTGKFWTFGKSLAYPRLVNKNEKHQLTCVLLRKE